MVYIQMLMNRWLSEAEATLIKSSLRLCRGNRLILVSRIIRRLSEAEAIRFYLIFQIVSITVPSTHLTTATGSSVNTGDSGFPQIFSA